MGLMFACPRGDKLIGDQLSIQAQNNQAIRNAKIMKHSNIIKLLIENGACI